MRTRHKELVENSIAILQNEVFPHINNKNVDESVAPAIMKMVKNLTEILENKPDIDIGGRPDDEFQIKTEPILKQIISIADDNDLFIEMVLQQKPLGDDTKSVFSTNMGYHSEELFYSFCTAFRQLGPQFFLKLMNYMSTQGLDIGSYLIERLLPEGISGDNVMVLSSSIPNLESYSIADLKKKLEIVEKHGGTHPLSSMITKTLREHIKRREKENET